jgi:hypothetical protein
MQTTIHFRSRSLRRLAGIAIAGATGALLIQSILRAGEGAAARSDGVRAVEDTRRSDSAAAPPSIDAALQFRMDEMRQRRTGHEEQRREKLRRLTPDERRRRIHPPPIRRPRRYRDFSDALERVNHVRRQLDIPPFKTEP